jgi:uncharacterized Zn finger protein
MNARGFPAFSPGKRGRGHFARSWWGRAWIKAMEDTALDQEQLKQGRKYAWTGYVGAITVSPGRIAASVRDYEDDTSYRTVVRLAQLSHAEWARFLDQVAVKAGHIAALLDGDMPDDLIDSAESAGVRLLPDIGDLDPDCDCPGWELPCKHAAALAYQASWLLDADPFVLLLVRGRGEHELVGELQTRNEIAPAREVLSTPALYAFSRDAAPLPDAPPVATTPTPPLNVVPVDGINPEALRRLAADAASRARELLVHDDVAALALWQDTVRIAATHPEVFDRLSTGRTRELTRAVRAWTFGGLAGLRVLDEPWNPPSSDLARARAAWEDDDLPGVRVWRNRWTITGRGVQLRYARNGRWYPYREEFGEWWPAGPPQRDPAIALAELLSARDR